MKQLWLKIGLSFVVLFFVAMAVIGVFAGELMKSTYLNMKEQQLTDDAKMLLHMTDINQLKLKRDSHVIQKKLAPLSEDIDARITVIDKKGVVIADTKEKANTLTNHLGRPEVKAVLKENARVSSAIRESDTVGYSMLYVAVPIKQSNEIIGVVRISVSLKSIESAVSKLWLSLFLILAVALLIIAGISVFIARKITRPVKEIIHVSTDLASGKYSSRIHGRTSGELQDLSLSINQLAESLANQMKAIKENEQQLTAIVDHLVSGVMLINHEKQIVLTNRSMQQIAGEKVMIGKPFYNIVNSYALSQLIEKAYETKSIQQQEMNIYSPGERIVDASVSPILLENQEISGVILLLHDITKIRRLENMRSEFVANVSHELKTPVTALKGFAETLLDGAMYDEALLKQFLNIIKEESDRLNRLIIDILALSRIEQGNEPSKRELIDLNIIADQSIKTMQEIATEKQIALVKKVNNEHSLIIMGDPDSLKQILINLLANAINYTPEKGEVVLQLIDQQKQVEIIVQDNGIGIPEKDLKRIFERFYRVDKARSRHSGGTGLGLSIVKHLVDGMSGSISVTSTEYVGSAFHICIPK